MRHTLSYVSAVLLFSLTQYGPSCAAEKPNIILVLCDDLGWGDTGFNGNKIIRTPNLDKMAASGLKFNRFYAASAVCSPTRASVVTGRHPYRLGILGANSGRMLPQEYTLAELLKKLGYKTGHFGKWHLGTLTKTIKESNRGGPRGVKHYSPPWENGFDVCFSTEAKIPTYDPMLKPKDKANRRGWEYIQDDSQAVPYGTHYWNQSGEIVKDNLRGDNSRVIMDRVVPFIRQSVGKGQPFFTIVWFHTPHLPVVAGPKHAAMYQEYDTFKRNFYGCVTAMDEQVGRLRTTLRELDIADNTMLWFCSDNGPEGMSGSAPGSAGPFRGRKRDLFEGGIRVPGLLEWPAKVKPGSVTDFPSVTSDYVPTMLDVLGIEMPDGRPLDGISLLPMLKGKMSKRAEPIGFAHKGKIALTDNRYKIMRYDKNVREMKTNSTDAVGDGKYMLFDLIADPAEKNDLAKQHPKIVQQMTETLEAWLESCAESNAGNDYADTDSQ